ncbi:MAG: ribosomal RNA small subunit methyltransferase A [Planctomycetes bacterium]|nr:ribosomal RNA small subunit methyltransferase A [Planctomycetota bacterium]
MSAAGQAGRGPWAELRAELVASGFRPSRRLGQNFLLDENLLRAIARDAALEPGARVLEVGPGLGFLTRHLLALGVRVTAVEIDPRLADRVAAAFASDPAFALLRGDVLAGKHAYAPAVRAWIGASEPWHLVANLPYAVAGPVLAIAAALDHPPTSISVLVQLELAERVVARPDTEAWGPLSIRVQVAYTGRILRRVPPDLFWPRPQVESAVLRLDLRPDRPSPERQAALSGLVERLFQRRRQRLARVLGELAGSAAAGRAWAAAAGLSGEERAEVLDLEALFRLVDARPPGT